MWKEKYSSLTYLSLVTNVFYLNRMGRVNAYLIWSLRTEKQWNLPPCLGVTPWGDGLKPTWTIWALSLCQMWFSCSRAVAPGQRQKRPSPLYLTILPRGHPATPLEAKRCPLRQNSTQALRYSWFLKEFYLILCLTFSVCYPGHWLQCCKLLSLSVYSETLTTPFSCVYLAEWILQNQRVCRDC